MTSRCEWQGRFGPESDEVWYWLPVLGFGLRVWECWLNSWIEISVDRQLEVRGSVGFGRWGGKSFCCDIRKIYLAWVCFAVTRGRFVVFTVCWMHYVLE